MLVYQRVSHLAIGKHRVGGTGICCSTVELIGLVDVVQDIPWRHIEE